jgi:hypothetical protein
MEQEYDMKKLKTGELYAHLSQFLQAKGIELKDGSYTERLQKGCTVLTDSINFAQGSLKKAKTGVDQKLDQMRQVIHEKTAPKTPPGASATPVAAPTPPKPAPANPRSPKTASTAKPKSKRK